MYQLALLGLLAIAEARFGQEQVPIPALNALKAGPPGVAQTLAGGSISTLLAATNACAKLQQADKIVSQLGTGADVISAAIGLVAAEKNFNPFVQSIPTICSDPTLPATPQLRGITPLIDPAVGGSGVANALSAKTKTTPLDATGKSVADLLAANGFTNFTTQDAAGTSGAAPAGSAAGAIVSKASTAASDVASTAAAAVATASSAVVAGSAAQCAVQISAALASASAIMGATATAVVAANDTAVAAKTTAAAVAAATNSAAAAGAATSGSSIAGADFGTCNPTIKFEGGLGGRRATEFTFQSQDPKIIAVQQEALNPNIITNAICNSLINLKCGANAAALSTCASAKAAISALGTRDVTTAQKWNQLVGFAGVSTNPDGGASAPAATATAAAGKVRRWQA